VLVNVQAVEGGQVSELKREIFADAFPFHAPPRALTQALESALDQEQFQLRSSQEFLYQGHLTAEAFARLEPWERELALQEMAVSVAYHLQIPEEAWRPASRAMQEKIHELLERDGVLSYALSLVGIQRCE